MFKILNSVILCVVTNLAPFLGLGQDHVKPKFSPFSAKAYDKISWGFRAGISMTTPHFADVDARKILDAQPTLGWTAGALVQFKLNAKYAFQTEFGYSQKTSVFIYDQGFSRNEMVMNFVDASMLLRRKIPFEWGKEIESEFIISIGPNVNYWLDAKGNMKSGDGAGLDYTVVFDEVPDANYNNLYLNGINRALFGIELGIGVNAPITARQKVYVEFRATLGQTNLGTTKSTSYIDIVGFGGSTFQEHLLKSNLKTFSISAAYTFSYNYFNARKGHSTKDKLYHKPKHR
ncbi:MAG: porin family protein [Cytophagales bacterium]|nr:porin family protein [Cytophagales bacterium]